METWNRGTGHHPTHLPKDIYTFTGDISNSVIELTPMEVDRTGSIMLSAKLFDKKYAWVGVCSRMGLYYLDFAKVRTEKTLEYGV